MSTATASSFLNAGRGRVVSVAGYTKITEGRRRMAQEETQRRGL